MPPTTPPGTPATTPFSTLRSSRAEGIVARGSGNDGETTEGSVDAGGSDPATPIGPEGSTNGRVAIRARISEGTETAVTSPTQASTDTTTSHEDDGLLFISCSR